MKKIPESELKFTFSRSSGAGGQNVNKVNTKATLSWDINESMIYSEAHKERFKKKYARLMVGSIVVIHSQKYRSQPKNIEDCKEKLHSYLSLVERPPKKRLETKPTKASIKKRQEQKSRDSVKKKLRQEKF